MRRTNIMATVADTRCAPEFVSMLHGAGMDSVRINSAHVNPQSIASMVKIIRESAPGVKILMDTKGPEIRTTNIDSRCGEAIAVAEGSRWNIGSSVDSPCTSDTIYVAMEAVHRYVKPGMTVLVDDGELEFLVEEVKDDHLVATARRSGSLGSRKTVAIPEWNCLRFLRCRSVTASISQRHARWVLM